MSDGLGEALDAAWAAFEAGARDADAAGRTVAVASVRAGGGAEARMMVLRAASREDGTLQVQSDAAAGKVAEFGADPRGTVLLWDPEAQFQVRARVTARIATGAEASDAWDRIPEPARARYGGTAPGTPIAAPEDVTGGPDPARFAVLTLAVDEIETLRLGDPHRRALFRAADGWRGRWLSP